MSSRDILIVRSGNATVRRHHDQRREGMFDKLEEELLDLAVTERGHTSPGHALAAIPLCCSIVLVLSCSSSRIEAE
jgi:hypothetical protein